MRYLLVLLLGILAIYPLGPVSAQDASPASTTPPRCEAPDLPPGTPTSIEVLLEQGTPTAGENASTPGLPILGDDVPALPPPNNADLPGGQPADTAIAERADGSIRNLIACLQGSDQLGFAMLVTERYRIAAFGTDNPYNAVMSLEGYPDVEITETGNAQVYEDGRVSTDITLAYHTTRVYRFRAYFMEGGDSLQLDEERALPFDNADVTVEVEIASGTLEVNEDSLPTDSLIGFKVTNNGAMPFEIALLRLSGDVVPDDLTNDPSAADRLLNAGGVAVDPGESASFAVTALPAGTYVVVAIVEDDTGESRVEPGMIQEVVVDEIE